MTSPFVIEKNIPNLSQEIKNKLLKTTQTLFKNNKGIFAVDSTPATVNKRFEPIGIDNTIKNRQAFRECLLNAPEIENYISGVILNEETFDQTDADGKLIIDTLVSKEILLGLKTDKGLMNLKQGESISVGINDLENRLNDTKYKGVSFAKWRSYFTILEDILPTDECIESNCIVLCKYALISQRNGIVPIIEPEIGYEGEFSMERMEFVAKQIYSSLFRWLNFYNLFIPGIVFKVSFITAGKESTKNLPSIDDIGNANMRALKESIPCAIGGIVFLSGGHSSNASIEYLSCISRKNPNLFKLSFCFSRAFSSEALIIWGNSDQNIKNARKAMIATMKKCVDANSNK